MKPPTPYRSTTVLLVLLLACLAWATPPSRAAISILDTTVYPGSGHVYHLLSNSTWTDAQAYAVTLGGNLVTIDDFAENNYLTALWATNRSLWIGLNDAAVEGVFQWASGSTSSYRNFRFSEPNNGLGAGEDYAYIYGNGLLFPNGQWNDLANLTSTPDEPILFGVVEIVPEPSTVALGCLGAVFAIWARLRSSSRKIS